MKQYEGLKHTDDPSDAFWLAHMQRLGILLEVGGIGRFYTVGDYSSYSRYVDSKRSSNGKKKGENNKKNGNKYLAWAYVEAANFAMRYNASAKKFYQRKLSEKNAIVATKALANKICRASYLKTTGFFVHSSSD